MLPQPGSSRLTSPQKIPAISSRMFSRSLLRRRRFYVALALFVMALYYFRVLDFSPDPITGYEAAFNNEMNHAIEVSARTSPVKYLHFKVAPFARRLKAPVVSWMASHWSQAKFDPGVLMNSWIKKLQTLDVECVEIVGELFVDRVLDSPRIQNLYDIISESPVVKQYTFLPNLQAAASNILPFSTQPTLSPTSNNTVVLHAYLPPSQIDDPCSVPAAHGAPFRTFAHIKGLPTGFELPATRIYYEQRCKPSVQHIVGRLGATRVAIPALKHVYVVDGPLGLNSTQWVERKRWFEALRFELTTKNGWETVRWAAAGAKTESVAIDMELAITGHVYIGNGFSDFSSNVVLLRLARGTPKGNIRFL
ncbi:Transmembrane protein [Ceratobasidium theobromae]|uniref:Transmembrane protein n=1 Tax=Ceratobasidium theobromae TaxID=1582974 RepID=A0A5N5QGY5_9AGAM|nr:Transmembrane protein [Ceratobasidium theobromae]